MIIYLFGMRLKDDDKQTALFEATVKLVNEIGFAASSVSKIAKQAGVSPATIYVYYRNKEDLLVSTYIEIKRQLGEAVMQDFEPSLPIPDILKNVWFKMFDYIGNHLDYFQFTEQFANSPYSELVDKTDVEKYFEPLIETVLRGIQQKIIKDVNFDILTAFMVYPIMILSNPRLCRNIELNHEAIETAFQLAWDAIKR
jgi:AcrR family transcriptional regulator